MYLAELHFGNGYMEIGLLISSLHGWGVERVIWCIYTSVCQTGADRKYIRAQYHVDVFAWRKAYNNEREGNRYIYGSFSLSSFSALHHAKTLTWDCALRVRMQSHVSVFMRREAENNEGERDTQIHHFLSVSWFSALRRVKTPSWDCTLKETDSVKLDKKKTSIFFALMYFLSAPVRQTVV